jgi:hypothetical protein
MNVITEKQKSDAIACEVRLIVHGSFLIDRPMPACIWTKTLKTTSDISPGTLYFICKNALDAYSSIRQLKT